MGVVCSNCKCENIEKYRTTTAGCIVCFPCYQRLKYLRSLEVPEHVKAARKKAQKEADRKYREKHREELNKKSAIMMAAKRKLFPEKIAEEKNKYYQKNKEKILIKDKEYRVRNREDILKRRKKKYEELRQSRKRSIPRHYSLEKNKIIIREKRRKENLERATPKWVNLSELELFYKNCPPGCVVDHIVPLDSPNVCGLNVICNLQYLPEKDKKRKGNRFDGTYANIDWERMPENGSRKIPREDREKAKIRKKRYINLNQERYRELSARYHERHYLKNKEAILASNNEARLRPEIQFSELRSNAKRRNIEICENFNIEEFKLVRKMPCYYCKADLPSTGSCIDRKDDGGPYSLENCVPCCPQCNYLKSDVLTFEEMEFVSKCLLENYNEKPIHFPLGELRKTKRLSVIKLYWKLKRRARDSNILLAIDINTFSEVTKIDECHYCGGNLPAAGYGLDRKDSTQGYTKENVVTCCKYCNRLKGDELSYSRMLTVVRSVQDFRKIKYTL